MQFELAATSAFGIEAVLKREIEKLGYKVTKTEDGRVRFEGDERAVVRSNLWLRTADRVYLKMAEFGADTFEDLFQQTKAVEWEKLIPLGGKVPVVGTSVKSVLHSVPACQSIIKKAIVSRLADFYSAEQLPETGAEYRIRFSILKDHVIIFTDTSGEALHKRGYRIANVDAPMKETLASAMVQLSFWKEGAMRKKPEQSPVEGNGPGSPKKEYVPRVLVDTCCGSGTILIEAAMLARNIAPGLSRTFASEGWDIIPEYIWKEERKLAYESVDYDDELYIRGYDIDPRAIRASIENAREAGVEEDIQFINIDMTRFSVERACEGLPSNDLGIIITNPPYGERIGSDEDIDSVYGKLASIMYKNPTWSIFFITTVKDCEDKYFGRKADKRRKLYNGRLETQLYQYHGARPGEKERPAPPKKKNTGKSDPKDGRKDKGADRWQTSSKKKYGAKTKATGSTGKRSSRVPRKKDPTR